MFSFAEKSDLKPDEMTGQKTSMKSTRLRKVYFSYVLVFIHIAGDFCGKKTTTQLRLFKQAQLCLLHDQQCGVVALKENSMQHSFMQKFGGYTSKALNAPMQTSYSFYFNY